MFIRLTYRRASFESLEDRRLLTYNALPEIDIDIDVTNPPEPTARELQQLVDRKAELVERVPKAFQEKLSLSVWNALDQLRSAATQSSPSDYENIKSNIPGLELSEVGEVRLAITTQAKGTELSELLEKLGASGFRVEAADDFAWVEERILPTKIIGSIAIRDFDTLLEHNAVLGIDVVRSGVSQGPSTVYTDFASQTSVLLNTLDGIALDGISTTQSGFSPFDGTSAAAPHVAGMAALLLEARPDLLPGDISSSFRDSAIDIESPGYDHVSGKGRFDAMEAAEYIKIWQNDSWNLDVNGDGFVTPVDALLINSAIATHGSVAIFGSAIPLPLAGATPEFVDVNGDNYLTAADHLLVVNYLNS